MARITTPPAVQTPAIRPVWSVPPSSSGLRAFEALFMDGDELFDSSSDLLPESLASLEPLDAFEAELGALEGLEVDWVSDTELPVDAGVEELPTPSPDELLVGVSELVLEDMRLERRIVLGVDDAPPPAPAPVLLSLLLVELEGELDV